MERYSSYALAVAAALSCSTPSCKKVEMPADTRPKPEHVVLLHFNDLHGALEQAPEISCVVERARQECERKGCHVIVTNGGDSSGNTSVSEEFKGKAEVEFLNALNVDAVVPGNHDTDHGPKVFKESMRQGKNWVAANLYKGDAGQKPLPSYVIVKAGSAKVGIAGFTFPLRSYPGDLMFDDPLATARELMSTLEKESDVQVAIAHLENPGELEMAEQLPGLDAVLGGHDHVSSSDYCHETSTATPVCETPPNGKYMVRVDMMVYGKEVTNMGQDLISVDGCRDIYSTAVTEALEPYADTIEGAKQVVGFSKEQLLNNRDGKDGQNGANNFVAKVMLEATGAELAMINATGVRSDIPKGNITSEHIVRLVFDDKIVIVELTGAEIESAIQAFRNRDRYFAFAGFNNQTPLDPNKVYKVATTGFLLNGSFSGAKIVSEGKPLRQAIIDYLGSHMHGI